MTLWVKLYGDSLDKNYDFFYQIFDYWKLIRYNIRHVKTKSEETSKRFFVQTVSSVNSAS